MTNHFLSDEIFDFRHQMMITPDDGIDATARNLSQPERRHRRITTDANNKTAAKRNETNEFLNCAAVELHLRVSNTSSFHQKTQRSEGKWNEEFGERHTKRHH